MDIVYKPPMDKDDECSMLERNYVNCLYEKSKKDLDVPMICNVERVTLT